MDVNVTTEVKGYGAPAVSSVEIDDGRKPQVEPVPKVADSVSVRLDEGAAGGKQASGEGAENVSPEDLEQAVEEIQLRMDSIGSKLNFGLSKDERVDSLVIRITDKTNGELIKQFPSEEVIQLQEKLNDLVGLLFDKQA
jgi:flagellar protein FlaG